jgi:steroid 5-alpha reductase family enzyme
MSALLVVLFVAGAISACCWVASLITKDNFFIGSTVFTEAISRSKYPEYLAFQRSTSAVIPWFPRQVTNSATV